MRTSKKNSDLNIENVFKYEENINVVKTTLYKCLIQKLEILKLITEDIIVLDDLE